MVNLYGTCRNILCYLLILIYLALFDYLLLLKYDSTKVGLKIVTGVLISSLIWFSEKYMFEIPGLNMKKSPTLADVNFNGRCSIGEDYYRYCVKCKHFVKHTKLLSNGQINICLFQVQHTQHTYRGCKSKNFMITNCNFRP